MIDNFDGLNVNTIEKENLTPKFFQEMPNVSDNDIKNANNILEDKNKSNELPTRYVITRNESLEGDNHPITGVPFERKTVEVNGENIEGVFPVFDAIYEAKLPKDMYEKSDKEQFKECNNQLYKDIEQYPVLKNQFNEEQLEQIKDGTIDGTAPDGYVWHHNEEAGKMQLVDFETHAKTGHTGGRSIWGGGNSNR
ncbi:MAG: HNH endonuclease [Megamonas funiformis]|uniref:HNH endonuclease n=1 Tax=Megamonas funiformis TaxID=437897 RepID=UPI00241CAFC9|nr:HNH endonuclease [Megamonas funiformis]MDY3874894.1 HNH endonuclease [Megamonas funiformis]